MRRYVGILLILAHLISFEAQAASRAQTLLIVQILLALLQKNFDLSELDAGSRIRPQALNPQFFQNAFGNPFINNDPFRNDPNGIGFGDSRFAFNPSLNVGFNPTTNVANPVSRSAFDPSLNQNFGRNALANNNLENRLQNPVDNNRLGRANRRAQRPFAANRLFGEVEKHGQGVRVEPGRNFSDDTTELCGGKAYEAICGEMNPEARQETLALTQESVDKAVEKSAREVGMGKLKQILSDVSSDSLSEQDQKSYERYLSNLGGNLSLEDLVATQKHALASAVERKGFLSDKADAQDAIFTARVVETPDPNIPGEMETFIEHCGANGLQNNAFACADHSHGRPLTLFVCPGRKAAALARAGGDANLAMADLAHTVMHELTHLIGVAPTSPFNSDYNGILACIAQKDGLSASTLAGATLGAEYVADHGAGAGLAQNLADGVTFGMSPGAYVKTTLQRLCGTGGKDHPSDKIRMEIAMSELKNDPLAREVLHCAKPADSEKGCSLEGSKK